MRGELEESEICLPRLFTGWLILIKIGGDTINLSVINNRGIR